MVCFLYFPFSSADLWVLTEKRKQKAHCELRWLYPWVMLCPDVCWCPPWTSWRNPGASHESGRTFKQPDLLSQMTSACSHLPSICCWWGCPRQMPRARRACLSLQNSICSASGPSAAAPLGPGSCPVWVASRAGSAWELLPGELRWGWQGTV